MQLKRYDLGLRDTVMFRPGTSDEDLIQSILIDRREYGLFINCNPRVVFDVGANIGATSILFANAYPNALIFAFEPDPENFSLLCKNTKAYPNVKSFMLALGGATGPRELMFSDNPDNLGGYSFHAAGSDPSKKQVVQVVDIREFYVEYRIPKIDLLKIDTEGCEFEIMRALSPTFPQYIMGETHGVDDWKLFDMLSTTHDLAMKKAFGQRCFEFHAIRKT